MRKFVKTCTFVVNAICAAGERGRKLDAAWFIHSHGTSEPH